MSNKILIIGLGYVGLSQAVLLHKNNNVHVLDINTKKINFINSNKSPLEEKEYHDYFSSNEICIKGYNNLEDIEDDYDFVLICLPTDFDTEKHELNTGLIEEYIEFFISKTNSKIIIKSTIPIGFTDFQIQKYSTNNISFSPEFLREGSSLNDVMNPSRIVYGPKNTCSLEFNNIVSKSLNHSNYKVRFMESVEAEAVKLFSNTYLAMRVAFFNEVDSFSLQNNLNSEKIISGISDDNRIGMFYNNPSFGFGGYCLPKDSRELSNYLINQNSHAGLINSINTSNNERKKFISDYILTKSQGLIGIYRINMKVNSKNFRESAILDIIKMLSDSNTDLIIYEPLINDDNFEGCKVIKDLDTFKNISELIISNRIDENILNVKHKVFSRDIFKTD